MSGFKHKFKKERFYALLIIQNFEFRRLKLPEPPTEEAL